MAYGIEVFNGSDKTLIDENSRQVQILKTGTMVPECMGPTSLNPFRAGGGGTAKMTIASGRAEDSLIFVRPKRLSGSRSGATLQFGVYLGTCTYKWRSTTATTVGTNYVYATPIVGSGQLNSFGGGYIGHSVSSTVINHDHTAETVGEVAGYYGQGWSNGFSSSSTKITHIEHHSGTTYKVYLNGTWNSSQAANKDSVQFTKTTAVFHSSNGYRFDPGWNSGTTADFTLEYKMGVLSNTAEESAGYGVEVYKSNGDLAFSSNRENFQIESITTGDPDLPAVSGSGVGEWDDTPRPIVWTLVEDSSNFDDYWAMVSVSGNTAAFVQGSGQNGASYSSGRSVGFSTGYCFVYPGNGFFDNNTMGNIYSGSGSSQSLGGTNNAGICMAPICRTVYNSAPQINQYAKVSDTHAVDATRSLMIGKFI